MKVLPVLLGFVGDAEGVLPILFGLGYMEVFYHWVLKEVQKSFTWLYWDLGGFGGNPVRAAPPPSPCLSFPPSSHSQWRLQQLPNHPEPHKFPQTGITLLALVQQFLELLCPGTGAVPLRLCLRQAAAQAAQLPPELLLPGTRAGKGPGRAFLG